MPEQLPTSVGLCTDPDHLGEFYMPNSQPGDTCPQCNLPLVIFTQSYRPDVEDDDE